MSFHNSGLDVTHNRVSFRNAHYVSLEDGVKHKLNPTQNLPLASTCIKIVLPGGSGSSISEMSEGSIPSATSRGGSCSFAGDSGNLAQLRKHSEAGS